MIVCYQAISSGKTVVLEAVKAVQLYTLILGVRGSMRFCSAMFRTFEQNVV